MTIKEKIAGGLYGLITGDALGVPYEFHGSWELPPYDKIEMTPPACFHRSHAGIEPGTWSDDGAQALCLLDSLLCCGKFNLEDFSQRLSSWYQEGLWAVRGIVFDVGVQTGEALHAHSMGMPPKMWFSAPGRKRQRRLDAGAPPGPVASRHRPGTGNGCPQAMPDYSWPHLQSGLLCFILSHRPFSVAGIGI